MKSYQKVPNCIPPNISSGKGGMGSASGCFPWNVEGPKGVGFCPLGVRGTGERGESQSDHALYSHCSGASCLMGLGGAQLLDLGIAT